MLNLLQSAFDHTSKHLMETKLSVLTKLYTISPWSHKIIVQRLKQEPNVLAGSFTIRNLKTPYVRSYRLLQLKRSRN